MKFDTRKRDLARIHTLQKQLGMSADDASALKLHLTGQASSADMTDAQRLQVANHLQGLADRLTGAKPPAARKNRLSGPLALMWSLWQQCADAKVVNDRRYTALESFAKGSTGVEKLEWLSKPQQTLVIEALKSMKQRGAARV